MEEDGFPEGIEREKSCGALVIHDKKILFVKNKKHQHWGIPKGHIEGDETELECARREIEEEVNLEELRLIDDFERRTTYHNKLFNTIKTVVLFVLISGSDKIGDLDDELDDHKWCDIDESIRILDNSNAKAISLEAVDFAKERGLL